MIYLDNAATSWPKPEAVYQAADRCLRNAGSPGRGSSSAAQAAAMVLYDAREALAELFGIQDPLSIAFTCSATDGINTALFGLLRPGDIAVTTAMEHNSVTRPLRCLEKRGVKLRVVPCDKQGRPDMAALRHMVQGARLLVMTHASNVTGTLMPVGQAGIIAREAGCLMMVDAAQTAGVEDIDVRRIAVDVLACPGHKGLLGPPGTGFLYIRPGVEVVPLRLGGTGSASESDSQPDFMPDRLESGTPNTPGIAGLAAGVRYIIKTGRENIRRKEQQLVNQLWEGVRSVDEVSVYGPDNGGRAGVVSLAVQGRDSMVTAHQLERDYGVVSRAGLHCAPWAHRSLGTLAQGTVRFSPGYFITPEEIDTAVRAIREIAKRGEGSE